MSIIETIATAAGGAVTGGGAVGVGLFAWLRARERRVAQTVHVEARLVREREVTGQHRIAADVSLTPQLLTRITRLEQRCDACDEENEQLRARVLDLEHLAADQAEEIARTKQQATAAEARAGAAERRAESAVEELVELRRGLK